MLELPVNRASREMGENEDIDEMQGDKDYVDKRRKLKKRINGTNKSEALKGKKPTRNANSKIKVNKEAGPISPVLMD